ncbi:hypothetical protein [Enemella sp. A6]|uniref:hypothetical protein n=1 Tax=Enemella sp. A6 TaxID=3440152 RepID=UPI003EC07640
MGPEKPSLQERLAAKQAKLEAKRADSEAKYQAAKAKRAEDAAAAKAKRVEEAEARKAQDRAKMAALRAQHAEAREARRQADPAADLKAAAKAAAKAEQKADRQARAKLPTGTFDKLRLSGGVLHQGILKSWPAAECSASVESGSALQERMTATRVIAGAVLAGGLGAVIGAMAKKKSGGEMFLVIEVPGDAIVLEVAPKQLKDAHRFVAAVNASV